MTSRDFCYWLQGHFEISNPKSIGVKETQMIKKHLALVFKHEIDPSMGDEAHQEVLNEIHGNSQGGNEKPGKDKPLVELPFKMPKKDVIYRC